MSNKISAACMYDDLDDIQDHYNELELYINVCHQCGFQQSGYDDTSTSPAHFYCTFCWEEFNAVHMSTPLSTNSTRHRDQKLGQQYVEKYEVVICKETKKKHAVNRKRRSRLDRQNMECIVQQFYRLHHNEWHKNLQCLVNEHELNLLKLRYQSGELYLVYTHDPMLCAFNWKCHTLLVCGFCHYTQYEMVPDVITIMIWKYYTGFTGFDIKQIENQDARIRVERRLNDIDYHYKAKWYENEMVIALVSSKEYPLAKRKKRKFGHRSRMMKKCHLIPLYKMTNCKNTC